ncbi:hypothetical protein EAI_12282, partial [Harpegnathos saltator]
SNRAKFLGITLDHALTWKFHIAKLKTKTIPRINILKSIMGISWGAHPAIMLSVYKNLIRSVLDWGCQAYLDLQERKAQTLDRLQFAAFNIILGLMKTTPTNVILDLSGERPLPVRRSFLAKKYIAKALSARHHP